MSFRDLQDHLEDMRNAIALVEQFTAGKDFENYQHDVMLRSAVERQLQIISEAAYRIGDNSSQVDPGTTGGRSVHLETSYDMPITG